MTGRRQNSIGDRVLMALVFLFLYAPIIILIVFSFNAGTSSSVWKGFSLKWYESLLSNRLIMNSVYTTLMVSLLSTIVAAIAGTFAAIGLYAMSRRRRAIVNSVNNIPMMNADIVTGVSLCLLFVVFFNGWGAFAGWVNSWQSAVVLPERLTMGFGTLLIAHICFNIPYVILSVGPKLRQMDRNLIDAAQDLGCTWMQAFWRVVIPEIKPGIVSGALTAFTMSVDDFIISYFTAGTSASTLAMTIYGMTKKRVSPEINAISTLLFVTVLVLLAIINLRDSHAARREHHAAATAASGAPMKHHRRPNKVLRRVAAGVMACVLTALLVVTGRSVQSERVVNVCSWGEYIDEELITQFEEETGIRVNYQTAESNEALYSLIKMGGADFDVIVPSDYMIARLIQEDMLAELDYSHIPNFDLIDDTYKNLSYDPENKYTVPYAWGTLGIIYNTTMVSGPITSWDAMFDPQYAGQVLMINNSRDALAAALLDLGYSINTTDDEPAGGGLCPAEKRQGQRRVSGLRHGRGVPENGGRKRRHRHVLRRRLPDHAGEQRGSGLRYSGGGQQLVRGRHVRPEGHPAHGRGGGVDQLHRLHQLQPGQHGLYLVRVPQPGGAGAVPGLLPGGQRGGAGPRDLRNHGAPGGDPGPLRDL